LGHNAVKDLEKQGVKVNFHQLDIDDIESINRLAKYIKEKYNGLDILINNAAIAYKNNDPAPFSQQAEHTVRVNLTGTLNLCNALFPLLRPHARFIRL
jgi:NAD(P)-dependent dehydrogenase (short-subunit alcohol dehydrogenase family)